MMKTAMNMKHLSLFASLALLFCAGISCTPVEKETVAKAVIASSSVLQFEAVGAAAQSITVYADGDWTADSPDWITLSQTSGSGTVEGISVTAADNKDGSGILMPRRDTIAIHGKRIISYSYIIVIQEGDKYRGAVDATVSTLASVKDGQFVNFSGATVMATDGSNVVLSDGKANLLMTLKQNIKPGDVVSFKGVKETENGKPVVKEIENFKVDSHSDPAYPSASDVTASLDATTVGDPVYVTVSGVYDGSALTVAGATKTISPSAAAELGLSDLVGHKATLTGYLTGVNGNKINMIVTAVKDDGIDMLIYFKDDFEWIEPWSSASGAGDAVKDNDPGTTAPNVFTASTCAGFTDEMLKRGYGYIWGWAGQDWSDGTPDSGNKRTLYLQRNYLKFGKTSYNSGIILPAMSEINGTADVELSFDWCWQVTGAYKADIMTLTVEVVGEGTCADSGAKLSSEIESTQSTVDGESKIEWQSKTLRINGVNSSTRLIIRPTNADPAVSNPERSQNRWYLDNILVVPAEGSGSGGEGGEGGGGGTDAPATSMAKWQLDKDHYKVYGPTFGCDESKFSESDGYLGENDPSEGDGGKYIDANVEGGKGRITYVSIDKTTLDTNKAFSRNIGGTGEPYMKGAWPGDYWLFTVDFEGSYKVGAKVHFSGTIRASGGGIKHWIAEVNDGGTWVPVADVLKTTVEGTEVEYTIECMNTDNCPVDYNYTMKNAVKNQLQFRVRATSLMQAKGGAVLTVPTTGTIRFKGGDISPYLEISQP